MNGVHTLNFSVKKNSIVTPNHLEAMHRTYIYVFKETMDAEIDQLNILEFWVKVYHPLDINTIDSTW